MREIRPPSVIAAEDAPRMIIDPASLLRWTAAAAHSVRRPCVLGRGFDNRSIRRNVLQERRSLRWFELLPLPHNFVIGEAQKLVRTRVPRCGHDVEAFEIDYRGYRAI